MPGLDEKRGTQRQHILRAGTISFDGSGIDCLVRKMSGEGANLEVESQIGIPNSFDLVIDSEHSRLTRPEAIRAMMETILHILSKDTEKPAKKTKRK